MLQLGDALDIDNDRFHLFTKHFVGELPEQSDNHFQKHQAIRQLKISPEEISIEADCQTQEALRLVRSECDGIESILKSASYHWSEISPKELKGCLPTMRPLKIRLTGSPIPKELVTAKFNISQKKAFQLLEGANIYSGEFTFLRELLQNALDATKIQCWKDYISRRSIWGRDVESEPSETKFKDLIGKLNFSSYPIELGFRIAAKLRKNDGSRTIDEYIRIDEVQKYGKSEVVIGVVVTVRDYGTGISKKDLTELTSVGSSYSVKKREIYRMPEWIRPTGQFGIGLQSVFLVCSVFDAYTRTRNDERYEINFSSAAHQSGYINAKPIESIRNENYGTTFEIFVSNEHKLPHKQCIDAWNLEDAKSDRFSEDYEANREIRHAKELLTQMVMYIDKQIGETIFPICLYIENELIDEEYMKFIRRHIRRLCFDSPYDNVKRFDCLPRYISWMFRDDSLKQSGNELDFVEKEIDGGKCRLDLGNSKFRVWNEELNASLTLGIERLMGQQTATRIYLKGIFIKEYNFQNDAELLESIDIKSTVRREYININRNVLTEVGSVFIENIYEKLMDTVRSALELLQKDTDCNKQIQGMADTLLRKLSKNTSESTSENIEGIRKQVWFLSCLAFYARIEEEKEYKVIVARRRSTNLWNDLLRKMGQVLEENTELATKFLKKIPVYSTAPTIGNSYGTWRKNNNLRVDILEKTLPELLSDGIRIGIVSKRENAYSNWRHYVVSISESFYKMSKQNVNDIWEDLSDLEEAGNLILKNIMDFSRLKESVYDVDNEVTLRWMLTNAPSLGIWASDDGNTRLNVLSRQLPHTIYYNENMKYLLLERLRERSQTQNGGKRYMTLTWRKYDALRLEKEPTSVCYISRGYLNLARNSKMLLPLLGEKSGDILKLCTDDDMSLLRQAIERYQSYFKLVDVLNDYSKRYKEAEPANEEGLYKYFVEQMDKAENKLAMLVNIAGEAPKSFIDLCAECQRYDSMDEFSTEILEKSENLKEWIEHMPKTEDVYLWTLENYFHGAEDSLFKERLKQCMLFIQQELVSVHESYFMGQEKVVLFKTQMYGSDTSKQRMLAYVVQNCYSKCSMKEIEVLYECLSEELIDVMYRRKLKELLKEVPSPDWKLQLRGKKILLDNARES